MFELYDFGKDYKNAHLADVEQSEKTNERLLSWSKTPKNILYFCGNVGTGKTYFAAAFYNYLMEQKKNVRAYSEEHLMNELKFCMNIPGQEPTRRIQTICECEYLILDDMGSSYMTDWKKEMLFYLIDLRDKNSMSTLITSNLKHDELKEMFHTRFASRIYASKNVVIELNGPDRRQKQ